MSQSKHPNVSIDLEEALYLIAVRAFGPESPIIKALQMIPNTNSNTLNLFVTITVRRIMGCVIDAVAPDDMPSDEQLGEISARVSERANRDLIDQAIKANPGREAEILANAAAAEAYMLQRQKSAREGQP